MFSKTRSPSNNNVETWKEFVARGSFNMLTCVKKVEEEVEGHLRIVV